MSLRFAILGLLVRDELSGYEITRRFERSVGYFWHARSQQIYPQMARLEKAGDVRSRHVEQVGRPDKRLYRITPAGEEHLREWVVSPSPLTLVKDEFMVKVWSLGTVAPAAAALAVAGHRRQHEERLCAYRMIESGLQVGLAGPADAALLAPYLTLRGGIAMEEAFIRWCGEAERLFKASQAALRRRA